MLTGFEIRAADPLQNTEWTTLAEEAAFLSAIAALGSRVRVSTEGEDASGNPIRRIDVAWPSAQAGDDRTDKLVFVAQQHGGECAGREALLQLIRKWATTTDHAEVEYLSRVQICCIPTANPSGFQPWTGWTYQNAAGVNLNRDHLALTQPETRVIQAAITLKRPVLVIDSHENGSPTGVRAGLAASAPRSQSGGIRGLSTELRDRAMTAVASTTELEPYIFFAAAAPSEHALHNIAVHRNALNLLIETDLFSSGSVGDPRAARVNCQIVIFEQALAFHREKFIGLRAARDTSIAEIALSSVGAHVRQWDFGNGKIGALPRGYMVSSAAMVDAEPILSVMGVEYEPIDGGFAIWLDQPSGRLVPFLMDSRAHEPPIVATALDRTPSPTTLFLPPNGGWRLSQI